MCRGSDESNGYFDEVVAVDRDDLERLSAAVAAPTSSANGRHVERLGEHEPRALDGHVVARQRRVVDELENAELLHTLSSS